MSPKWKRRAALGAAAFLMLGLGCGVGWLMLERLAIEALEAEAKIYGVRLSACRAAVRYEKLRFSNCQFETVSGDAEGTIHSLTLTLNGLQPKTAEIAGVDGFVHRPADANALELGIPRSPVPLRINGANIKVRVGDAKLGLVDLSWDSTAERGQAKFQGPLGSKGTVELRYDAIEARGTVGDSPLNFNVSTSPQVATVEFRLRDFDQPALAETGKTSVFTERSRLDIDVHLTLPRGLNPERPKGRFVVDMKGLKLPDPPHLSGISFGRELRLRGSLRANRPLDRWDATKLKATLGSLALRGDANLDLRQTPPKGQLQLLGALSCATLARTALAAGVGTEAATLGSAIGQRFVHGHVGVIVSGSGDFGKGASGLQLHQVLTGGCGLKLTDEILLPRIPAQVLKQLPDRLSRLSQQRATRSRSTASGIDIPSWDLSLPGLPRLTRPLVEVEH